MCRVMRFGQKGKLNPRYVGPYPVIKTIWLVIYHMEYPNSIAMVHNVFDILMLRRAVVDPLVVVEPHEL